MYSGDIYYNNNNNNKTTLQYLLNCIHSFVLKYNMGCKKTLAKQYDSLKPFMYVYEV